MNVNCPHCNTLLEASDNVNNEVVQCPVCNKEFIIQGTVNTHRKIRVTQNSIHANPHGVMPQKTVPNYLVPAILVTIFCCIPLGVPAIVYASQVNNKLTQGDIQGAQIASNNAKMWMIIAIVVGIIINALCFFMGLLGE